MTISIPSANAVAFPSLVTVKETIAEWLDRWQNWSDETFGGEYRDALETLIRGLVLLVCVVVFRAYAIAKVCILLTFSYWHGLAEQQFLVESGLWLEQLAFELLPVSECLDECWSELAQQAVAEQQILAYELNWVRSAETCWL